jgi:hypothetical protein
MVERQQAESRSSQVQAAISRCSATATRDWICPSYPTSSASRREQPVSPRCWSWWV